MGIEKYKSDVDIQDRGIPEMKNRIFTIENSFYLLALLIGFGLRIARIGDLPLTDIEANWALQALQIVHGNPIAVGAQPGYILLTSIVFFLFGSGTFVMGGESFARLVPLIAGCLIIFLPYLFREQLGKMAAVILAFILAIEPGFIAISKMATGDIIAVTSTMLALGCMTKALIGKSIHWGAVGGVFIGLAILGGSSFWFGIIGFTVAILIIKLQNRSISLRRTILGEYDDENNSSDPLLWRSIFLWAVVSFIAVGSLFFRVSGGLGAALSSLIEYVNGWHIPNITSITGEMTSVLNVLSALIIYQPLAIFFSLWSVLAVGFDRREGWQEVYRLDRFLLCWLLIATIFLIIYPGRQVSYLVWMLLPMWALAARQAVRFILEFLIPVFKIENLEQGWFPVFGHSIIIFVIVIFSFLNFTNLINVAGTATADQQIRWLAVIGAIVMILLVTFLVGWGWSPEIALSGFVCGIGFVLLLCLFSASWNAAGLGRNPDQEMWRSSPSFQEADLMVSTIGDISEWNTRDRQNIDIAVINLPSSSLRWALRDFLNVDYLDFPIPGTSPSVVITPDQDSPTLAATYTGQDFILEQKPDWNNLNITNWIKWIIYRNAPLEKRSLVLWVRSDLFPGAVEN